jgi:hypothetical protein
MSTKHVIPFSSWTTKAMLWPSYFDTRRSYLMSGQGEVDRWWRVCSESVFEATCNACTDR